jgi:hypothetical protein
MSKNIRFLEKAVVHLFLKHELLAYFFQIIFIFPIILIIILKNYKKENLYQILNLSLFLEENFENF